VAGVTGLEPATSCVTGKRSNQLSYTPNKMGNFEKKTELVLTARLRFRFSAAQVFLNLLAQIKKN
jgi:hypothetical protein